MLYGGSLLLAAWLGFDLEEPGLAGWGRARRWNPEEHKASASQTIAGAGHVRTCSARYGPGWRN